MNTSYCGSGHPWGLSKPMRWSQIQPTHDQILCFPGNFWGCWRTLGSSSKLFRVPAAEIREIPFRLKETFLRWGRLNTGTGCPEGLWTFHTYAYSNLARRGPGKPAVADPALGRGWTRWSSEFPASFSGPATLWETTFLLFLYISEAAHSSEDQGTWFLGLSLEFTWRDNNCSTAFPEFICLEQCKFFWLK